MSKKTGKKSQKGFEKKVGDFVRGFVSGGKDKEELLKERRKRRRKK